MSKAAKLFASQRIRDMPCSDNPETTRVHEISQSRIGFAAEQHHIKTKFRTRLARVRKDLKESREWVNASAEQCVHMEMDRQNQLASERDRELRHTEKKWIKLNSIDDENLDDEMNGEYESMELSQKKKVGTR